MVRRLKKVTMDRMWSSSQVATEEELKPETLEASEPERSETPKPSESKTQKSETTTNEEAEGKNTEDNVKDTDPIKVEVKTEPEPTKDAPKVADTDSTEAKKVESTKPENGKKVPPPAPKIKKKKKEEKNIEDKGKESLRSAGKTEPKPVSESKSIKAETGEKGPPPAPKTKKKKKKVKKFKNNPFAAKLAAKLTMPPPKRADPATTVSTNPATEVKEANEGISENKDKLPKAAKKTGPPPNPKRATPPPKPSKPKAQGPPPKPIKTTVSQVPKPENKTPKDGNVGKPEKPVEKTVAERTAMLRQTSSNNASPTGTKTKRGKKLKKKKFMLQLDNIFANAPGGPAPMKKKKPAQVDGSKEDVKTEDATEEAPAKTEIVPKEVENMEKTGEQNLNNIEKKPKMGGKRKRRKKKKFDAKKTAFSAQPVRQYQRTSYQANALKLTAQQRVQVMTMVKEGKMSVDEAMDAVLKHDENVRAVMDEQNDQLDDGKKRTFSAAKQDFDAADLSKLSDEQRMKVMMMVKDGKISIEDAIKEVKSTMGPAKDKKKKSSWCTIL
eukprot:CAMPEP_0167757446 /NCGR_PEP_ID=MMETSP0110_2-20121227/9928_1 /TAXON_ID=629695 /ORGANISM="Gymnochlora sp., Strain CCMP2014" /LENGTH=553 /DNA_ID=CAMNT_0007643633 /DNA_START=208 /DNA_END=1869 /DNA_ORIENTATION=+